MVLDSDTSTLRNLWDQVVTGSIPVNKKLLDKYGVKEALLFGELVSKQKYFTERNMLDEEGYFYNSQNDLGRSTGIRRRGQESSLPKLVDAGLIKIKRVQGEARRFKVDIAASLRYLNPAQSVQTKANDYGQNEPAAMAETFGAVCTEGTPNNGLINNEKVNTKDCIDAAAINNKDKDIISSSDTDQINELMSLYNERFEKKIGSKASTETGGKNALTSVLKERGFDKTKELLNLYFRAKDEYIQNSGYSLKLFSCSINKLLANEEKILYNNPFGVAPIL